MEPDEVTGTQFRMYRAAAGYLRVDWFDGAVVTGQDAHATLQAVASLADGRLAPLLVDTRSALSVSREARMAYAGSTLVSRVALYVDSPLSRIIANFYIGQSGPSVPVELFTDLDDAQRWLLDDH
ncbi:MAG: STAS/SEC14 domain-containing protein [Nitriliruptor sp.]|nr:MAG: STAS/SEC14 domain-containing protein [Nitriliruptor sp.]